MKHKLSTPTNIALIGFMGSGKTSIGKYLARTLGYKFLDSDRLVEKKANCSIAEIFEKQGEKKFRELESAVLKDLFGKKNIVLATGGGAILDPQNRTILRDLGTVVWIHATTDTLFDRAIRDTKRPLLNVEYPRQTFNELLKKRLPIYEASCHVQIDTTNLSYEPTIESIVEAVNTTILR